LFKFSTFTIIVLFSSLFSSVANAENITARPIAARVDLTVDEKSTISLFEKSRDSVVYITTSAQVQEMTSRNIFSIPHGSGSGFIWDEFGHVVTNYHVLQDASAAVVKLNNGKEYAATLVGASQMHDIAVLQINTEQHDSAPLPVGTSHDLKVGQTVYAIGNPFGFDWTLTNGIVSALNRSLTEENGVTVEHLIQTNASINPGNSGGPLLDSAGRLIGINTAIYSPNGANSGIGFAVPVDTVNRVVSELIKNGKYVRPTLGIEMDEGINEQIKRLIGINGIVVLTMPPGSIAAQSGLKGIVTASDGSITPNDIIIAIGGKPVDSVSKLIALLDDYRVGDTITLTLTSQGKIREIKITLQPEG
jgi:S1-C subfamily serine protease